MLKQDYLSVEGRQPQTGHTDVLFGSCDFDFDPITFKYKTDLDILCQVSRLSEVRVRTV